LVSDFDDQVKTGHLNFKGLARGERYSEQVREAGADAQRRAEPRGCEGAERSENRRNCSNTGGSQEIADHESEFWRRTFGFNNDKAILTVMENQLQDARTEKNEEKAKSLEKSLEERRKKLNEDNERIFELKEEAKKTKEERNESTKPVDDLRKLVAKIGGDVELMRKKLAALQPDNYKAKFSSWARRRPLLQFVNPEDKVRELVLPDVLSDLSFTRVATTDRCATCHVNIDRKDFTEERVLGYLEEQQ
jgi:hypothetical protein